jgi:hypothetical protein
MRFGASPNDEQDVQFFLRSTSDAVFWSTVRLSAQLLSEPLQVPDYFLVQLLAIEDKRYLVHPGVDPLAIIRAALSNVRSEALEGGSTITQQLYDARREIQGLPRPRTFGRKLRQAAWALWEDLNRCKLDVLREYLAIVYWGRSYHGLDAAAEGYFGTERSRLTVAQSFFLAERIASPNVAFLGRLRALMSREQIAVFFSDPTDLGELIELYDEHFQCGSELWPSPHKAGLCATAAPSYP